MNALSPLVLLTRPQAAAKTFARDMRAAGLNVTPLISPLIEIQFLNPPVLNDAGGVVFTSKNGVAAAGAGQLPAWCVGDATADAARALGWRAMSAGGDVEALIDRVLSEKPDGTLVHVRGEHARGHLADRLTAGGVPTCDAIAYRQVPVALNDEARAALSKEAPVIVPLFSPRTARLLRSAAPFDAPLQIVAISAAVADELRDVHYDKKVLAARPDANAMLEAVASLLGADCRIEDRSDLA